MGACGAAQPNATEPGVAYLSWTITVNGRPTTCADVGATKLHMLLLGPGEYETGSIDNDVGFGHTVLVPKAHDLPCSAGTFTLVFAPDAQSGGVYHYNIDLQSDAADATAEIGWIEGDVTLTPGHDAELTFAL